MARFGRKTKLELEKMKTSQKAKSFFEDFSVQLHY